LANKVVYNRLYSLTGLQNVQLYVHVALYKIDNVGNTLDRSAVVCRSLMRRCFQKRCAEAENSEPPFQPQIPIPALVRSQFTSTVRPQIRNPRREKVCRNPII